MFMRLKGCNSGLCDAYGLNGRQRLFPNPQMMVALKKGQNALLEAPTGSGKTLSLLCTALAWQEAQRSQVSAEVLLTAGKRPAAANGPAADLDNYRHVGNCLDPVAADDSSVVHACGS